MQNLEVLIKQWEKEIRLGGSLQHLEERIKEWEINTSGLQYAIGQIERFKALWSLISEMLRADNASTVSDIMKCWLTTPAEKAQDIFALLLSGGKRGGFFVDFGACDGLRVNNTVTLERQFGWSGILAEPCKFWHDGLERNRTAKIDKRCVSSVSGEQLEFYQSKLPGNSSVHRDYHYLNIDRSYTVETVSLCDLLREHGAPKFIDFLSVDTEGHEKEVFSGFDFDRYRFGFICVEQDEAVTRGDDGVSRILENAGYKVIFPREKGRPTPTQITGNDLFFVPKTFSLPAAGA